MMSHREGCVWFVTISVRRHNWFGHGGLKRFALSDLARWNTERYTAGLRDGVLPAWSHLWGLLLDQYSYQVQIQIVGGGGTALTFFLISVIF